MVKAADRQGQRGLTLVERPEELRPALARSGGVPQRQLARGGARRRAGVDRQRVLRGRRLHGAHRHGPPHRPTAGVRRCADARLALRARDRGGGRRRPFGRLGARRARRPDVHAGPPRPGGPARDGARGAAGRRARCGALRGGARGRTQRPRHRCGFGVRPRGSDPGGSNPGWRGLRALLVAQPGVLQTVEGLEEAASRPGVRVRSYRQPGWRFEPLRRGADRAGAVLAVGDSRDDAGCGAAYAVSSDARRRAASSAAASGPRVLLRSLRLPPFDAFAYGEWSRLIGRGDSTGRAERGPERRARAWQIAPRRRAAFRSRGAARFVRARGARGWLGACCWSRRCRTTAGG